MTRLILPAAPTAAPAKFPRNARFVKSSASRSRQLGTQQTLWRHDDERLDEIALHLPAQNVEILRRGREIADLDIILGAEPAGNARGARWNVPDPGPRTRAEEENDAAGPLPFRFRRDDELIDDGLRAIGEIAELRFPQAKHVRVIE